MTTTMDLDERELLAAAVNLCVAQERWLLSDPLRFVGVDLSSASVLRAVDDADPAVEVEIVTRPKPSGGVRAEVFPDISGSLLLQVVADRVAETLTEPSDSLSMRLFGVRLQGENPYDVWNSAVASWLRSQLDAGHVVLVCDLRDYFASIRRDQLECALSGRVAEPLRGHALRVLDAIHADCKRQRRPTTGLPVSPADFFWLVADLVLLPLDGEIRRISGVTGYARWVDDLFVSTVSSRFDEILGRIEVAVGSLGFQLNRQKTRVFGNRDEFRSEFHVAEHDLLSHLFSTVDRGVRAPRVEGLIEQLHRRVVGSGVEDARLAKRIYGLAALIGSPILVGGAGADLERFPTAETAILNYLGGQAWPQASELTPIATIERAATDSRVILALRSLLNSPSFAAADRGLLNRLEQLALATDDAVHPYARAVMTAVLAKYGTPEAFTTFAGKLLPRARNWGSSMARRVAYEFLFLDPSLRAWVPGLRVDSNPLVRPLARLFGGAATEGERSAIRSIAEQRRPLRMSWGDMEARLALEVLAAGSA